MCVHTSFNSAWVAKYWTLWLRHWHNPKFTCVIICPRRTRPNLEVGLVCSYEKFDEDGHLKMVSDEWKVKYLEQIFCGIGYQRGPVCAILLSWKLSWYTRINDTRVTRPEPWFPEYVLQRFHYSGNKGLSVWNVCFWYLVTGHTETLSGFRINSCFPPSTQKLTKQRHHKSTSTEKLLVDVYQKYCH